MSIWFKPHTVEQINAFQKNTLSDYIGIRFIEIGDDYLTASMPVNEHTKMPRGLLHGGANCVLAETVASMGAGLVIDPSRQTIVGLEINANHVRGPKAGQVIGTGQALHLGKSTHVWEIRIHDEEDNLTCISRMTIAVLQLA